MEKWRWCDFRMTGKRQWKRDETNLSPRLEFIAKLQRRSWIGCYQCHVIVGTHCATLAYPPMKRVLRGGASRRQHGSDAVATALRANSSALETTFRGPQMRTFVSRFFITKTRPRTHVSLFFSFSTQILILIFKNDHFQIFSFQFLIKNQILYLFVLFLFF